MHAIELLGVGVAAGLPLGGLAEARVALAQREAFFLGGGREGIKGAMEQAAALDQASLAGGLDAVRQQPFAAASLMRLRQCTRLDRSQWSL